MKKIMFYVLAVLLISCTNKENTNAGTQKKESDSFSQDKTAEFIAKYTDTHDIFKFENNEVIQVLALKENEANKLSFVLKAISKNSDVESLIDGSAVLKEGDVEIDEDEEGIGYPVSEYIYNDKCWIALRLALQSKDMVRINTADCDKLSSKSTPFDSQGILKKIN